jgi:hypothetical protein
VLDSVQLCHASLTVGITVRNAKAGPTSLAGATG